MNTFDTFKKAFETRDIFEFMNLVFPPEWKPIIARIMESGVTMSETNCSWAPRWSKVPPTIRNGKTELLTYLKSAIFRSHDCLHQLWGLPIPGSNFSEEDFYIYKRSQMCGEVAVLTLTEFVLCDKIASMHPELKDYLFETRNALSMLHGPLAGRDIKQIAMRMDTLLHKKIRPSWVRNHKQSMDFCDDYIPMLQDDRDCIDSNWKLMKDNNWLPVGAPNARYSSYTDGLELTVWMITDFFHLMETGDEIDYDLMMFNRSRREGIVLPEPWNNLVAERSK